MIEITVSHIDIHDRIKRLTQEKKNDFASFHPPCSLAHKNTQAKRPGHKPFIAQHTQQHGKITILFWFGVSLIFFPFLFRSVLWIFHYWFCQYMGHVWKRRSSVTIQLRWRKCIQTRNAKKKENISPIVVNFNIQKNKPFKCSLWSTSRWNFIAYWEWFVFPAFSHSI